MVKVRSVFTVVGIQHVVVIHVRVMVVQSAKEHGIFSSARVMVGSTCSGSL